MVTPVANDFPLLGWGFLGTGSISATVAEELRATGFGRLAAICGRDMARSQAFAAAHGFAHAYSDDRALLDDADVDAIYIALPHSLHVDVILRALDAGKHILCEKPLGMTADEVARVMAHPRAADLTISEGFMVRHHPQWRWIENVIRSGGIGEIRCVQAHSCLPFPTPEHAPRLPGENSLLLDIGCYSVHLARAIFGTEPERAAAFMGFDASGVRDILLSAQLEFPAGQAQIFVATGLQPARRMHILGTGGSLEVSNPIHPSPAGTMTVRLNEAGGVSHEEVFARAPQYALQFQDFSYAVAEGRAPLVSLSDALGNARVLDLIRQSAGNPI